MGQINPWENIKVPNEIIKQIESGKYYPSRKTKRNLRLSSIFVLIMPLICVIGLIALLSGVAMFVYPVFSEDFTDVSLLYPHYGKFFWGTSIIIIPVIILIIYAVNRKEKKNSQ